MGVKAARKYDETAGNHLYKFTRIGELGMGAELTAEQKQLSG